MLHASAHPRVSALAVRSPARSRRAELPPPHALEGGRLTSVEGGLERLRELEALNEAALSELERTLSQHAEEEAAGAASRAQLSQLSSALAVKSEALAELDAAAEALERELFAQEQSLRVLESEPTSDVSYPAVEAARPARWKMLAVEARRRISSHLVTEQQDGAALAALPTAARARALAELSVHRCAALLSGLGPGPEQLRCLQTLPLPARADTLAAMPDTAAAAALASSPPIFAAEVLSQLPPHRAASLLQRLTVPQRASLIALLGWGARSALFESPPVQQPPADKDGGFGTLRQGLAFAVLKLVDVLVLLR